LYRKTRSFKPYPNKCDSVKQASEKHKKTCKFDQKIPVKILQVPLPTRTSFKKIFTILGLFAKSFPAERKPSKCPTTEKKTGKEKQKKRGGEKTKGKR